MKRKNKAIAGAMSMMLLCAAVMPVSAAAPEDQTSSTQLNAEVDSKYTLTIPSTTNIQFNELSTKLDGELKVTGNVDTDEQIVVKATANPLTKTSGEKIDYKLTDGTTDFTGAVWNEAELRAGLANAEGQKAIDLFIEITQDEWNQAKAGSYTGNVTFVASLDTVTTE